MIQNSNPKRNTNNKLMEYHIFWQQWKDPITQMKSQIEDQANNQRIKNLDSPELSPYEEIEQSQMPNMSHMQPFSMMSTPMISTPMGLVPAPIPDMSSFNFWVGHANFYITHPILKIIEQTLGVETLDLFSPYRFRIAIGQAFDENTVKTNIAHIIKVYFSQHAQKKNHIPTK